MFTDVVGYTALMAANESEALFLLKKFRKILKRAIHRSGGEWLETAGDGVLASFASAIDAVNCALVVQHHLADEDKLRIRIGIHVGDVIYAQGQVFGDGVNIASRIESLAGPGDIAISGQVHDAVRNKQGISTEFLGRKQLKNVDHPVDVYLLSGEEIETPDLSELDERDRDRVPRRWALTLATITVVAILAVIFYPKPEGARASLHSVAVLPFRDISEHASNEYFSDGLAEEILDTLTHMEGLQVASRTSSFSFKDREINAPEIAETLQVASLLNGSVRKQDNQVRISVELVDGESGMRLWSQTYDRQLDDIFVIQEDIAREVAGNLRLVVGPETEALISTPPTESIEAYDFYLQGLAYLNRPPGQESLNIAEQLFTQAIEADAGYAKAYAGLCQVGLARFALSNAPRHYDEAREHCDRALELQNSLVEVRVALGNLYRESGEYDQAEQEFMAVLDQIPHSANALMGLAATHEAQSRLTQAEAGFLQAVNEQPGSWKTHMALGEFLFWRSRYEDAHKEFKKVVGLSPNHAVAYTWIGSIQTAWGDLDGAEETFKHAVDLAPNRHAYRDLGLLYLYRREFDQAVQMLEAAVGFEGDDHWSWGDLADAYHHSGRPDKAATAYVRAKHLAEELLGANDQDWVSMGRLADYEARLGNFERAAGLLEEAKGDHAALGSVLIFSAVVALERDDVAAALEDLKMAVQVGGSITVIGLHPAFESLHGDPAFGVLLKKEED